MSHTNGHWTLGWGNGVTGPTTPCFGGITVHESIFRSERNRRLDAGEEVEPMPCFFEIITKGMETLAMFPNIPGCSDGMANAARVAEVVNATQQFKDIEQLCVVFSLLESVLSSNGLLNVDEVLLHYRRALNGAEDVE